ncbi:ferritin-like protein (plasmid) [Bradyrhizobium sp. CCGUVB1N3]|uniref:ferritin-like protein n=1 Tax=Bradyrhizobium sp. CCGUVB1N3 TaxID=2949629 RepID=UPI0020B2C562|nr:ferritin-like protein [Bradyrhizobium sp. CCGUVB1N3]MCP3477657.1 ferritin-like protein [Bradyrhizobium sp. CCGUVB1N3]
MQPRQERQIDKSRELSWYEHLLVLLQMGASIEHALMVQYLYAAYSLRDDVEQARRWRETLLLIAREEMGHLLTVQNILALLGGPINIDREDYPFDTPFQSFPFQLERLTRGSLACYCYAEMPVGLEKDPKRAAEYAAIRADAEKHVRQQGKNIGAEVKHVGELYHEIVGILGDPEKIPNHCFVDAAFGQMSWDDWGRSYRGEPAPKTTTPEVAAQTGSERATLFISKATTREQAILALAELSEQGEGLVAIEELMGGAPILRAVRPSVHKIEPEDSHYGRFHAIYEELCKYEDESEFSWNVPHNPSSDYSENRPSAQGTTASRIQIESRRSRRWAGLFNIRYRMLLTWLMHALMLTRRHPPPATAHLRGQIIHRAFGEMYNIKAISEVLVKSPLKDDQDPSDLQDPKSPRAGPPFQMPFRLTLPPNERDTWRIHREAIATSLELCEKLLSDKKHVCAMETRPAARNYLAALKEADEDALLWAKSVFDGLR